MAVEGRGPSPHPTIAHVVNLEAIPAAAALASPGVPRQHEGTNLHPIPVCRVPLRAKLLRVSQLHGPDAGRFLKVSKFAAVGMSDVTLQSQSRDVGSAEAARLRSLNRMVSRAGITTCPCLIRPGQVLESCQFFGVDLGVQPGDMTGDSGYRGAAKRTPQGHLRSDGIVRR